MEKFSSGQDFKKRCHDCKKLSQSRGSFQIESTCEYVYWFAELRASKQQIMTMKDWLKQIEKFLHDNDQQILQHSGQISHSMALAKAEEEYEKYHKQGDKEYMILIEI